jgi:hypothetical protein
MRGRETQLEGVEAVRGLLTYFFVFETKLVD